MAGLLTEKIRESQKRKGLLDLWSGLLTDTGLPELFSGKIGGQTLEQGIQNRLQPNSLRPALSPQQMVEAGLNIAGVAPVGMTVWHGSPHKFDKFDMSKIGTGEGAQAYGHGLYMAEKPQTAIAYRNKLSTESSLLNPKIVTFKDGSQVDVGTNGWVLNMLKKGNMDAQEARAAVEAELKDATYLKNSDAISKAKSALKALDDGDYEISGINAGSLYKVDIPDEAVARFLDWDKPLSEQAPEVQKALQSNPNYEKYWLPHLENRFALRGENPSVGDLHNYLKDDYMPDEIAELFKSQGIPGIRYLDGGSRNAGQGTSNYVLFDDQLPRILERNGEPTGLQPWAPGEANSLLGIQSAPMRPRNALGQEIPGLYPWAVPLSAGLLGSLSLLPSDAEAR